MTLSLHDTDFYSWTQQQAELLKAGNLAALDIANLIDEIEDMGRSEKRELTSRLEVLLLHLLKWQHQPQRRGNSWLLTIKLQRNRVQRLLKENPGLQSLIIESVADAYEDAQLKAATATGLNLAIFPQTCPWTFDQIMDPEFWPE
ncbi:hypothetical protein TI04_02970 [Achromatium sp. WMS2]|nr:hypothetical protein TI04_02970 [Achromatium sp. WMS2]